MRQIVFFRLVCLALFTMFFTTPVSHAQDNTQERLRQTLKSFLNEQEAFFEASDDVKLKREGELTIEPQDDYYVVTMPHLELHLDEGQRVDFGIISINVRPAAEDKLWHISMALPTPLLVYNKQDLLVARLDIGQQKFSGTWHTDYQRFRNITAQFGDIMLKEHKSGATLKIPELRIDQKMDSKGTPPAWSGKRHLTLQDTAILTGNGHKVAQIGETGFNIHMDSYSPQHDHEFRNEWIMLIKDKQNIKQNKNTVLKAYDLITKKLPQIHNGGSFTVYAQDIRIKPPEAMRQKSGQIDTKKVNFDRLQYSFGFTDIQQDNTGLNFSFEMKGFKTEPKPGIARGLVPKDMRMHFALNNIPYADLVAYGRKQLNRGQSPDAAANKAMRVMPKMLSNAGTTFTMKDNYINADDYRADINATLKADTSAAMNFTLDAKAGIQGLKGLVNKLKSRAQKSDNPMIAGNIKKAIGMLTTVHMLGQQGEKGKDSRVYNIKVNKGGEAELNGSNLSNLMQAFSGNSGNSSEDATPPGLSGQ